jgi:phosphoribosyl-ATP pyrophosphohydrolase
LNDFLDHLITLIEDRKAHPRAGSYTNRLLAEPRKAAQKLGEEATETVVAALAEDDSRLISEAADLVYHLLVLLAGRNISWSAVLAELQHRHQEKE